VSVALALAFVGGFLATRLGLPAIVGYLLAGVVVGPFTPGFVADTSLAPQLAEIGVILLMFGVGIHFSMRDLLAVRSVAVPGAIGQIAILTALATGLTIWWGWGLQAGIVLGLAVSVASTVVMLRALMEGDLLETTHGKIAVGWLIVEDLLTVLALLLLPVLAGGDGAHAAEAGAVATEAGWTAVLTTLGVTLLKVGVLVAVMLFAGARFVPWLLIQVSRTGSRELFILAVLAVAFGIAFGSAALFGVSLALGAFLAGLVVGESDLSHRAAEDALPLRDAFAVLFFVSVGMLLDPSVLVNRPGRVLAVVALIVLAKPLISFLLVVVLRRPARTGLIVGAGRAQIGEFSFILAELGRSLGMLPAEGYDLVLAAALVSITLNPVLFRLVGPLEAWLVGRAPAAEDTPEPVPAAEAVHDHVVLCGYGRVGRLIAGELEHEGVPYLVVDQARGLIEGLQARGILAMRGDVLEHATLKQMHLESARLLVVAMSDSLATRHLVETARRQHPGLPIIARTHSEAERQFLLQHQVDAILAEQELALTMNRHALSLLDRREARVDATEVMPSRTSRLEPVEHGEDEPPGPAHTEHEGEPAACSSLPAREGGWG
jgi:CPA2 family monovalent cation:H+ antiporter-2